MNALEIIKQLTVRVGIKDRNRSGSGVFYISQENSNYVLVLTARHVIDGEKFDDPVAESQIVCQFKLYNGDEFDCFEVQKIIRNPDIEADQCILLLDASKVKQKLPHLPLYNILTSPVSGYNLHFRGYPEIFSKSRLDVIEAQSFEAKLNELDRKYFKAELLQDLYDSNLEEAKLRFGGISGSGLFIIDKETQTIHLAGLIKKFVDKQATLKIIKCSNFSDLNNLLKEEGLNQLRVVPGLYTKDVSYDEDLKYHIERSAYRFEFKQETNVTEIVEYSLFDLFNSNPKVSLLGVGGLGKSSELKYLYKKLRNEGFLPTPVINLQNLDDNPLQNILDEELPGWSTIPVNKLRIILDGLDETSNYISIIKRIERFVEKYPGYFIIISCRQNFYLTDSTIKDFTSFTLKELSKDDAKKYLSQNLKSTGLSEEDFAAALENLGCLVNPFYLVNFTELLQKKRINFDASQLQILEELVSVSTEYNLTHFDFEKRSLLFDNEEKIEKELKRLALLITILGNRILYKKEYEAFTSEDKLRAYLSHVKFWVVKREGNRFEHKNFSDYLVSKVIGSLSHTELGKLPIIKNGYLHPNFLNSTVQWLSLNGEHGSTNFLINTPVKNLQVLLGMDLGALDGTTKEHVFRSIFEKYEERAIYLDHEVGADLARLASSPEVAEVLVDFLLEKLERQDLGGLVIGNALRILENVKIIDKQKKLASETVIKLVTSRPSHQHLVHSALYALSKLGFNTKDNLDLLLRTFEDTSSQYIKSGLYYSIYTSRDNEAYVNFLLDEVDKLEGGRRSDRVHSSSSFHRIETELIDVKMNLRRALNSIKSLDGLIKILSYFSEKRMLCSEFEIIEGDRYDSDNSIKEKLLPYKDNMQLLVLVLNLYLKLSKYEEKGAIILAQFFCEAGKSSRVISQIIESDSEEWDKVYQVSYLLGEVEIDQLVKYYRSGLVSDEFIRKLLSGYRSHLSLKLKEEIYLRIHEINKDFQKPFRTEKEADELIKETTSEELSFILNNEVIQRQVEEVYSEVGKDQITFDNYDNYLENRFEYNNPTQQILYQVFQDIRNFISPYHLDVLIPKAVAISFVNNPKFEDYQIKFLYSLINNRHQHELPSQVVETVRNWVDKKVIEEYDLSDYDYVKEIYGLLWYFHQRLNIELPKNILFNFLHFDLSQYNFKEPENIHDLPFDLFESANSRKHDAFLDLLKIHIDSILLKERILDNIRKDLPDVSSVSRHLTCCSYFNLVESTEFIKLLVLGELPNFDLKAYENNIRRDAAEVLVRLNVEALEECLTALDPDDDLIYHVENLLLKNKSMALHKFLKEKLSSTKGNERVDIAKRLFVFEDVEAFEVYTSRVEETIRYEEHHMNNYLTNGRFISELKSPEAIPFLFRLLNVSYNREFKQNRDTNSLESVVMAALTNISKQSQVFDQIISGYKEVRKSFPDLKYLESHIEYFEEQKTVLEFNSITFEEAKAVVESITI